MIRGISIHAARTEGDRQGVQGKHTGGMISTHAPRTGGDFRRPRIKLPLCISTHAPAQGATQGDRPAAVSEGISTHAPRTGGDDFPVLRSDCFLLFQPTPPAQGATVGFLLRRSEFDISTHAPRTGGDQTSSRVPPNNTISTHAPRTGGDGLTDSDKKEGNYFNPRPPHRGRHPKTLP